MPRIVVREEDMLGAFAQNFSTLGTDVLGIGTALVTLIQDILTVGGGGTPSKPDVQYPFG
jgi:hypothetical protein